MVILVEVLSPALHLSLPFQEREGRGLLIGPVVKNLPFHSAGDMGSIPALGGSHVLWGQLSPRTIAY